MSPIVYLNQVCAVLLHKFIRFEIFQLEMICTFSDILLEKKALVDGILEIFCSYGGTMTHLIQFYRK